MKTRTQPTPKRTAQSPRMSQAPRRPSILLEFEPHLTDAELERADAYARTVLAAVSPEEFFADHLPSLMGL